MTYYAGFDIGGTNARLSLFDDDWQVLGESRRGVRGAGEPGKVAETMREMLADLCEHHGVVRGELDALGVGIAGQLDAAGQVVINAPNLGWRDVDFADLLADTLESDFGALNIHIANDLNALLWGEHAAGAVSDVDNALAVYVGTGIGGAILIDGGLVTGSGGKAGEIGHSKVVPGGRLCGCGERGCVEAYAGGVHLEKMAAEIAERDSLDEVLRPGEEIQADLKVADRLAADGREAFDELWEMSTDYLAVVLANACTLLNPAVLLLGGGILENLEDFRGRVLTKTTPLVLEAARRDLEIRFPELGDDAGVLGAAELAAGSAANASANASANTSANASTK
ncbi:MAG: ROK family protein [Persicimonas sp.]